MRLVSLLLFLFETSQTQTDQGKNMTELTTVKTTIELDELHKNGKLNGLFNVPNHIYHEGPGISSTGLKDILDYSPAHFKYFQENRTTTKAMEDGTLIHTAILEPHLFEENVLVAPACDRRTTEGKKVWADFLAQSEGKTVVDASTYDSVCSLAKSVATNKLAAKLLKGQMSEVSVYWTDEETGVLCKARADHINDDLIIDLKSCQSAHSKSFQKTIEYHRYHLSAAYYLDGFAKFMPVKLFAWLAVEKTPPYGCRFFTAEDTLLHAGRLEYREALNIYAKCLAEDRWPAYEMKFENISLSSNYGA
jgi:exodeoxyribonuclease VIII